MSSIMNFEITQGETLEDSFVSTLRETEVAPASDLATVEFLVKTNLSDADADALLIRHTDTAAELTVDDANAWTYTILATPEETAAMTAGRYKCVCTTIDAAGKVREAGRGDFILRTRGSDPSS